MPEWFNRYANIESVVGGGFYSLRKTKWGSKLVKADRSPTRRVYGKTTQPLTGNRSDRPITRRARTKKL